MYFCTQGGDEHGVVFGKAWYGLGGGCPVGRLPTRQLWPLWTVFHKRTSIEGFMRAKPIEKIPRKSWQKPSALTRPPFWKRSDRNRQQAEFVLFRSGRYECICGFMQRWAAYASMRKPPCSMLRATRSSGCGLAAAVPEAYTDEAAWAATVLIRPSFSGDSPARLQRNHPASDENSQKSTTKKRICQRLIAR